MRAAMEGEEAFTRLCGWLPASVDGLGGAGQAIGLSMLAADMATTEALVRYALTSRQRAHQPRRTGPENDHVIGFGRGGHSALFRWGARTETC